MLTRFSKLSICNIHMVQNLEFSFVIYQLRGVSSIVNYAACEIFVRMTIHLTEIKVEGIARS